MAVATLVSLDEYLGHTYEPDCEYVDGHLVERNVGEIGHGDVQTAIAYFIRARASAFWAAVEVRVQVRPDRYRVPDVVVVRGGRPAGRVITDPPELAIEVLSPDDRHQDLLDKVDDYLAFGVPAVWVVNPETGRAWIHDREGAREVKDGVLRNHAGDLEIPLSAL